MRILFHMLMQPGHLNPTFAVARALADRGHEVMYTSVLDLQPTIEARGFRSVVLCRDCIPRGRIPYLDSLPSDAERGPIWGEMFARTFDEYTDGRMEAIVRAVAPDVIAADVVCSSPLQYVAHRLQIPCVQISTSLSQRLGELPPLTSELTPADPSLEAASTRWQSGPLRFSFLPGVPCASMASAYVAEFCARFGLAPDAVGFESVFTTVFKTMPEVILAPSAIDFPRQAAGGPSYVASPLDLARPEHVPDELVDFVSPNRPLIYASLGSQGGRYAGSASFFAAVADAIRSRPDWDAVVTAGDRFFDSPIFAYRPKNLLVLRSTPQLWVLRRAAAFVTHAGLGSVRESIACGVPMIAVPQQFDQPGNAARIAHLGLGTRIPPDAITGDALARSIDHVLRDLASFKARSKEVDAACREEEARGSAVEVFERLGASRVQKDTAPAGGTPAAKGQLALGADAVVEGWMFVDEAHANDIVAGTTRRDPTPAPVEIGGGVGFALCRALVSALARSEGPVLVSAAVSEELVQDGPHVGGRTIHHRWKLDLTEILFDYARWCAERAAEIELPKAASTVSALAEMVRRHHELRTAGATRDAVRASHLAMWPVSAPLWHYGTRVSVAATEPEPHVAARNAHRLAVHSIVRRQAESVPPGPARATFYEEKLAAVTRSFASELERRVDAGVRQARVDRS